MNGGHWNQTSKDHSILFIVRRPAAAEQRGIAAPSTGAIPGPSSRRAGLRADQTLLCFSCVHAQIFFIERVEGSTPHTFKGYYLPVQNRLTFSRPEVI